MMHVNWSEPDLASYVRFVVGSPSVAQLSQYTFSCVKTLMNIQSQYSKQYLFNKHIVFSWLIHNAKISDLRICGCTLITLVQI